MPTGTRVRGLLKDLGFSSEDPFDINDAEREGVSKLEDYFLEHPIFSSLLGNPDRPESIITFAERGSGKTTMRRAIELNCHNRSGALNNVLAVSYTDFGDLLARMKNEGRSPTILDHTDEILRCAVRELITSIDKARLEQFEALGSGYLSLLRAYVDKFSNILSPGERGLVADQILHEIARRELGKDVKFDASPLFKATSATAKRNQVGFSPKRVAAVLSTAQDMLRDLPPVVQPVAVLLLKLEQQEPVNLEGKGYTQLLKDFAALLKELNYRAMYVLIDRIDEPAFLNDPLAAASFINPITSDHFLLDMEGIAFRIFLPDHLREFVRYRAKRVAVRHLVWSLDDLLEMLAKRIRSFSRYISMRIFFEPPLHDSLEDNFSSRHRQVYSVDLALIRSAHGLPRDLILRCGKVLEAYGASKRLGLLNQQDLEKVVAADLGNDAPLPSEPTTLSIVAPTSPSLPLHHTTSIPIPTTTEHGVRKRGLDIDAGGHLWRDGEQLKVDLPDTEFRLLKYLCDHRHQICANEDVIIAVWSPEENERTLNQPSKLPSSKEAQVKAADEQNLRQTIKRLRDKVEHKQPGRPPFIINRRGRGYELTDGE